MIALSSTEVALEALRNNYELYSDNVLQTATAILIAIGWFVTSSTARELVARNTRVRGVLLVTVPLVALGHVLSLLGRYAAAQRIAAQVTGLPFDSYGLYVIMPYQVATSVLVNLALLSALFYLVSGRQERRVD